MQLWSQTAIVLTPGFVMFPRGETKGRETCEEAPVVFEVVLRVSLGSW